MAVPGSVIQVMNVLEAAGHQAYLVGGSVRDILLGREPSDYDVATDARPEQVKALFPRAVPTGEKYGTITVLNGMPIEVTTFRRDGFYADGRRPQNVEFSDSLEEDVMRRDFTINALAMTENGILIDYVGGRSDLQAGIIRCVGDPDHRFREDALRMMRAVRFSSQLGFEIHSSTAAAATRNASLIANVSWERIRDELAKILVSDSPDMRTLHEVGLLAFIVPELAACYGFDQMNEHHDEDVFEHTMRAIELSPPRLNVRLAAMLHDVGKPKAFTIENGKGHFYGHHLDGEQMAREILHRLRFDSHTISDVCILVREHMSRYAFLRPRNVKRFINRVGVGNLDDLFDLQIADVQASRPPYDPSGMLALRDECRRVLSEKAPLTVRDLAVNGHDLMEWGMAPGREMGAMLQTMLDAVLKDPSLNTADGLRGVYQRYGGRESACRDRR